MENSKTNFTIRLTTEEDKDWIQTLIRDRWAAEFVVVHGITFRPDALPGFIAETGTDRIGLITFSISEADCEIVTLDSLKPGRGVGQALVESVKVTARRSGCRRFFVVTTNDNLRALRFYQRRGFRIAALRPNAIAEIRKLKPVPLLGENGIPIRDEIELEMKLD